MMDPAVKQAFARAVATQLEYMVQVGLPQVAEHFREPIEVEYQRITPLINRVRIRPADGAGPVYLDVIVKETFL
jgi:hypothetical protein